MSDSLAVVHAELHDATLLALAPLVLFRPRQLATSLGLSAVALSLPVTTSEAARGLVPPAAAGHFLGSAGSAAVLVMTFLAVTSSGASEQIAVSSIVGTFPFCSRERP